MAFVFFVVNGRLNLQWDLTREVSTPKSLRARTIGLNGDSLAVLIHRTIASAEKMTFGNHRPTAGEKDPPSPRALEAETKT